MAPSSTPAQMRFAWLTCQDWSVNHWAAMDMIVAEDLDFLVHLGDYIYESVGATFQSGLAELSPHPHHAAQRDRARRRRDGRVRDQPGRLPHAVPHLPRRRACASCTASSR
ncbi:alkaline phosphatase D family protein [Massilia sp. H-1]|nr:alkaline phosphatase D family protein [Massilia sp. H-1]